MSIRCSTQFEIVSRHAHLTEMKELLLGPLALIVSDYAVASWKEESSYPNHRKEISRRWKSLKGNALFIKLALQTDLYRAALFGSQFAEEILALPAALFSHLTARIKAVFSPALNQILYNPLYLPRLNPIDAPDLHFDPYHPEEQCDLVPNPRIAEFPFWQEGRGQLTSLVSDWDPTKVLPSPLDPAVTTTPFLYFIIPQNRQMHIAIYTQKNLTLVFQPLQYAHIPLVPELTDDRLPVWSLEIQYDDSTLQPFYYCGFLPDEDDDEDLIPTRNGVPIPTFNGIPITQLGDQLLERRYFK